MIFRRPDTAHTDWAISVVEPGAELVDTAGLRDGASPWLLTLGSGASESRIVLRVGASGDAESMRTEAAALRLASDRGIPVPELFGMRVEPGAPLLVTSYLEGSSAIPAERSIARLHDLGAIAARINAIVPPASFLPRSRPISGVDFTALREAAAPQALLERAEAAVAGARLDSAAVGFVHGDLWQGNVIWVDDAVSGVVDWDSAGVGPAGVDLGSLRFDAALCFGQEAANDVLEGWETEAGIPAADVAYWDLVAALSSPPALAWFVDAISSQGRPDVTAELLRVRRDEFLADALRRFAATAWKA